MTTAAIPPPLKEETPPVSRAWFVSESAQFRTRGFWLWAAFVAIAIAVGGRLLQVQIAEGHRYAAAAAAQHVEAIAVHGERGRILDDQGRVLVSNQPIYDVFADPGLIPADQRQQIATQLAPIVSLGPAKIVELISKPTRFVWIARGLPQSVYPKLESLTLPGIVVQKQEMQVYETSPLGGASLAANLLGYVNADGYGQYGVEGYYDSLLRGNDGKESTVRDLAGNSIMISDITPTTAADGKSLELGLDSQIQYWAEQALASGVTSTDSASGTLMVMDTKTGAIRAWAQYPTYDANQYSKDNIANFRDLAISDLYEPGSVEKLVTFAGGLDTHSITPQTTIDEGPTRIDGWTIHDWDNRAHGIVTMQTVLDESLNNGAVKVEQAMGAKAFYSTLRKFGIGAKTHIDLAGEAAIPLPPLQRMSTLDLAESAFGQHIQVTPIQMLAAVNAVANGGVWVQPHVVDSIIDPVTGKRTPVTPQTRRVVSTEAAATLTRMMTGAVEDKGAEGFMARIPGFFGEVAGKTGTASVAVNGAYGSDVITSFAGFMPAQNPRFTMLVILRKPHETKIPRFGSLLAAPVWRQVAEMMVDLWRIQP